MALSCGGGSRLCSDLALLWLRHGIVATALIRPLAWEPPYAAGMALKRQKDKKKKKVPVMVQWKQIRLGNMRFLVQPLASLCGLRIQRCHKLWCKSQTWLRSGVAAAVV